jgi:hypothetical protein
VKTQKILSMKVTADDERIHDDSKAVPELVENILKSDDMSTTTTAIGKLFGDDCAYEGNEIFRHLEKNGIIPCIKVRKRMREGYGKKGTSLEIYQFWNKEMIYKIGKRIAL